MSLPPLANVFAMRSTDRYLLDRVERAVRNIDPDREVRRPRTSWLVAVNSVPPGPVSLRDDADTFFTEGSDLFDAGRVGAITKAATAVPSSLARHEGDFGFLHVSSDDEGTFVRSCGGRVPIYVRQGPTYVALGTLLSDLVAFTPDEVVFDPLVCAIWSTGWSTVPEGGTFFRDVTAIPRGHFLTVTGNRTRLDRYWDPRPPTLGMPTAERRHEHIERFRAILVDGLARELDPRGNNLLTLSGGADSSSLAALAAGTLRYPISTLTLLPSAEPNRSQEMAYIENLRSHYEFQRAWEFPLGYGGRVEAAGAGPSVAFPIMHPALGLLPLIVREQRVDTLFGGEFADQVCGSSFTYPDWLRHTSLLQLVRRRAEWPQGAKTPLRWVKHRLIDLLGKPFLTVRPELPDYVLPAVREQYKQWTADRRRTLGGDRAPLRYLALEADNDGFLAMNWEVASALGIRRLWPFFNRPMLELAFDCHPWELVGTDTKHLLRAALEGLVPPMNLHRQTRGEWHPLTQGEPPPPPVDELDGVFDLGRLPKAEVKLGLPVSWLFRNFLDSVNKLRGFSPSPGGAVE